MAQRYERIYDFIKKELEILKADNDYSNYSEAFAHFMLKMILGLDDSEANESITDGGNDNGIDAVYIDQTKEKPEINFFQFKFPSSSENISRKGITEEDVYKFIGGFKKFTGIDRTHTNWNDLLQKKIDEYSLLDDTDINTLYYVNFGVCDSVDNIKLLKEQAEELENSTGNTINVEIFNAARISELYENIYQDKWPSFDIVYNNSINIFENDNIKVYNFYTSIKDLYLSVEKIKDQICDGNVRYFDPKSKINKEIIESIKNEPEIFYILNNGITIVCSETHNLSLTNKLNIVEGSIINGAQTVGCICKAYKDISNKEILNTSFVGVKVIEIANKRELVQRLVYTLNSQNKMINSFMLSNDLTIKKVQEEINSKTDYYLEIKNNEFKKDQRVNPKFNKKNKNRITLEKAIQLCVAYDDVNDLAFLAKNSKGKLFEDKLINSIVNDLNETKIVDYYKLYLKIFEFVSMYRAFCKDSTKDSILKKLKVDKKEIIKYSFLNTGDFLVLFAIGVYNRKNNINVSDSDIIPVLNILKKYFNGKKDITNLTRRKETFDDIRQLMNNE